MTASKDSEKPSGILITHKYFEGYRTSNFALLHIIYTGVEYTRPKIVTLNLFSDSQLQTPSLFQNTLRDTTCDIEVSDTYLMSVRGERYLKLNYLGTTSMGES